MDFNDYLSNFQESSSYPIQIRNENKASNLIGLEDDIIENSKYGICHGFAISWISLFLVAIEEVTRNKFISNLNVLKYSASDIHHHISMPLILRNNAILYWLDFFF